MKMLLMVLLCLKVMSCYTMEEKNEKLIQKYETYATKGWAAETIAFMKDPKNAENKDALQLKRYIEMVVETKKFYQQRYSMTEEQAIEKACEDTPIGSYDFSYIERGSRCGNDGLASYREEWKDLFDQIEAALSKNSANSK